MGRAKWTTTDDLHLATLTLTAILDSTLSPSPHPSSVLVDFNYSIAPDPRYAPRKMMNYVMLVSRQGTSGCSLRDQANHPPASAPHTTLYHLPRPVITRLIRYGPHDAPMTVHPQAKCAWQSGSRPCRTSKKPRSSRT